MLILVTLFAAPPSDTPKPDKDGRLDPKQFSGIVLDDKAALKTGEWIATTE